MMPPVDPRKEMRKARARIAAFITVGAVGVSSVLSGEGFGAWQWVSWVLGLIVIIIFTATAMASSGDRPGVWGRGFGPGWLDRDYDAPTGVAVRRWTALLVMSRLMPPAAAYRWLGEAESVLAEVTATRRDAAIRSYVRSAPRLTAVMWAHEVRRLARPGPRHPG